MHIVTSNYEFYAHIYLVGFLDVNLEDALTVVRRSHNPLAYHASDDNYTYMHMQSMEQNVKSI